MLLSLDSVGGASYGVHYGIMLGRPLPLPRRCGACDLPCLGAVGRACLPPLSFLPQSLTAIDTPPTTRTSANVGESSLSLACLSSSSAVCPSSRIGAGSSAAASPNSTGLSNSTRVPPCLKKLMVHDYRKILKLIGIGACITEYGRPEYDQTAKPENVVAFA
jgi:hypothetical protein